MNIKMAGYNNILGNNISNSQLNIGIKNISKAGKHTGINLNEQGIKGAQCSVTISHEGRLKSENSTKPKSIAESQADRLLIRQQRQAEENKNEYSKTIDEISELMQSLQNSYQAGEDEETIEKKQEALNKMLDLKKKQEEENEQRLKDAAKGIGVSKEQEEIDRKNKELLMMLRSFEDDDDKGGKSSGRSRGTSDSEGANDSESKSSQIQESAAMVGVSAARRELAAKGAVDELRNDGYGKIAEVNEIMGSISEEIRLAEEAGRNDSLSESERKQLEADHINMAKGILVSNYGEMRELRRSGLQEIRDALELDLKHIQINPLDGVKQVQQTIMDMGAMAALQEAAKGVLDKASKELEEEVQEALDKRNDIANNPDEKVDDEEEKAEIKIEEKIEEKIEKAQEKAREEKNSILLN